MLLGLIELAQEANEEEATGMGLVIIGVILLVLLALFLLALYLVFRLVRGAVRRARE